MVRTEQYGSTLTLSDLTAIPLTRINGEPDTFGSHLGNALLTVNVASKCGQTTQYEALEKLYKAYHAKGFEALGFPANDFDPL